MYVENGIVMFDEIYTERSGNIVKALHELKSLKPQLYSVAEYCEKSFLHNGQKEMIMDNTKDYAVRALVNAIDHLGTVASHLTNLFQKQSSDMTVLDFKVACLKQRLYTCQTYMDKECLKQQQLTSSSLRYHRHYILPNSIKSKAWNNQLKETDTWRGHIHAHPSGPPAARTLSWHLAAESKSTRGDLSASNNIISSQLFDLATDSPRIHGVLITGPSNLLSQRQPRVPAAGMGSDAFGFIKESVEARKSLSAFRSVDQVDCAGTSLPAARNRRMLSPFMTRQGYAKLKAIFYDKIL